MIRGEDLSYSSLEVPILSKVTESPIANSLVTAILVTLASYQAAAFLFDLTLGLKSKNVARVKTFGILMLTWKSSPLAVLNSVLRRDWITRLYYRGYSLQDTAIRRDAQGVKYITTITVFVLLVVQPAFDVVFLALTLSTTTSFSFREAGFGGVELGVHKDLKSLRSVPFMTACRLIQFHQAPNDFIDARFSLCLSPPLNQPGAGDETGLEIAILNSQIYTNVVVRGGGIIRSAFAELQTKEGSFFIKAGISPESARPLVAMAMDLLRAECGEIFEIGSLSRALNGTMITSVRFECKLARNQTTVLNSPELYISNKLLERVTLTQSNDFMVSDSNGSNTFHEAFDFHLLHRNKRYISLFQLLIVTAGLLAARKAVNLFLSNDIYDGIEIVVKDGLGFKQCDSMFWAEEREIRFPREEKGEQGPRHLSQPETSEFNSVETLKDDL